jgi:molybdate transport system substrate-binding protein
MKKLSIFLISFFWFAQVLAADTVTLTVSAASSLTNAFKEMAPVFESQNKGVSLQFNFAASGQLVQQVLKGAPVDVLACADLESMGRIEAAGWANPSHRKIFASKTLVVIVPKSAKVTPQGLSDLAGPGYRRLAIGLPASVPVGHYTQLVLEKHALWSALEPKFIKSQNVRQVLDYVSRAEVDAGFVYATDALMTGQVRVAFLVPTEKKILYPIAPIATSHAYATAQTFVAFVNSPVGREILLKHGFGAP